MQCTHCGTTIYGACYGPAPEHLILCPECFRLLCNYCEECGTVSAFGSTCDCNNVPAPEAPDSRQTCFAGMEPKEPHVICCHCNKSIPEDESFTEDDAIYCDDCHADLFACCERCSEFVSADDIFEVHVQNRATALWCDDCVSNHGFRCSSCETYYDTHNRSYVTGPDGNDYCENCSDNIYSCEACGDTMWSDDVHCTDGGTYCSSCAPTNVADCSGDSSFRKLESIEFKHNTSRRLVGFEIEAFTDEGIDLCELGCVHEDGSIRADDDMNPFEFASHASNGDLLLANIHAACTALSPARVNASCGLHVHLDMRDTSVEARANIVRAWQAFEPLFFRLVPSGRRDNHFCQAGITTSGDRYHALNTTALGKHGTYEIRLHQGTTNERKLRSWVQLLVAFFDWFQGVDIPIDIASMTPREQLRYLIMTLKLPLSVSKYLVARFHMYNADAPKRRKAAGLYMFTRKREVRACAA